MKSLNIEKAHLFGMYNQTCVQRPPTGPQNSGHCRQVVVVQRSFKK